MGALTPIRPVVVIGAGPTGLTAAIQLAQRGVDVLVLERWDDVYPLPRAIAMDDEVQRIVARLGLEAELAATTRPAHGMQLMDARHRVLARFDRTGVAERSGFWRAVQFHQPDLERLLRDRLASHHADRVTIRSGVEVTAIEQPGPGPAEITVTDRLTGAVETVLAEHVLGCDGANSVARAAIGSTMQDLRFEQRWLVVDVDTDADLHQWPGVHQVCDPHRAATFMQGNTTGRYRWELQLLDGEEVERDFTTIEQLLPHLRPWLGDVGADQLSMTRATEYTFRAQLADRWRDRRIFLLGDAAHLTPPFIGQGMAAGVRDATNLTWKVAGVLDGTLPVDALDSYERERRPHARSLIRLARLTGQVMTGGGRYGDVARRALVPLIAHAPGLRAQVLDSETPALTPNPWVHGGRRRSLPGSLVPNLPIGAGRLDAVLGDRWALVTTAPPSPSDASVLRDRGVVVVAATEALATWLDRDGARAALVRPDGVVMASGDRVSELCGLAGRLLRAPTSVVVP